MPLEKFNPWKVNRLILCLPFRGLGLLTITQYTSSGLHLEVHIKLRTGTG